MGLPPGPREPTLVQMTRFMFRAPQLLDGCRARYGDLFTVKGLGFEYAPLVVVSHPRHLEAVFKAPPEQLCAMPTNEVFRPFVGDGSVLVLSGKRHRRERQLLMPPLHGERMRAYGQTISEITERELERLPLGSEVSLHQLAQRITLEVILRAVFGVDEAAQFEQLRKSIHLGVEAGSKPYLLLPPFQRDWGKHSPWGKFKHHQRNADAILIEQIRRARGTVAGDQADVLSMLAHAVDDNGERMTEDELRDEMRTMLVAGHETTATALAWAASYIFGRADIIATLLQELRGVDDLVEQIDELAYLDATVKETLRLAPIAPLFGRHVLEPFELGGYTIPAGTSLGISNYLTHRREETFERPTQFEPQRFIGRKYSHYEYLPFGGGRRRCIGAALASYEMRMVIATLLRRRRIRCAPGFSRGATRRGVTLAPKGGAPVIFEAV